MPPAAAEAALGHIASGGVQFSSLPLSDGGGGYIAQGSFVDVDTYICTHPDQCMFERAYQLPALPQPLELSTVYLDNILHGEMSNAAQGNLDVRYSGKSIYAGVSSSVITIVKLSPMTSLTIAIPWQLSLATPEDSIWAQAFVGLDVREVGGLPTYNRFIIETGPEPTIDVQHLLSMTFVNDTPFMKTLEVSNGGGLNFSGSLVPEPSTWMMLCAGLLLAAATRASRRKLRMTRQFFLQGMSVLLFAFAYTGAGADELGANASFGSVSMLNGSEQLDYAIRWSQLQNSACALNGECRNRRLDNFAFPVDTLLHAGGSSSHTVVSAAATGGSMESRVPSDISVDTRAAAGASISVNWKFLLSPGDTVRITVPVELALIGDIPAVPNFIDSAYASLYLSNGRAGILEQLWITSESGPRNLSDTLSITYANTTQYTDFCDIGFQISTGAWQNVSAVPEPSSYAMLCAGFVILLIFYIRRAGRYPTLFRMQRFIIDKIYSAR